MGEVENLNFGLQEAQDSAKELERRRDVALFSNSCTIFFNLSTNSCPNVLRQRPTAAGVAGGAPSVRRRQAIVEGKDRGCGMILQRRVGRIGGLLRSQRVRERSRDRD